MSEPSEEAKQAAERIQLHGRAMRSIIIQQAIDAAIAKLREELRDADGANGALMREIDRLRERVEKAEHELNNLQQ